MAVIALYPFNLLTNLPLQPSRIQCRAPSDLVFVIKEQKHPRFARKGNNLHATITVRCNLMCNLLSTQGKGK